MHYHVTENECWLNEKEASSCPNIITKFDFLAKLSIRKLGSSLFFIFNFGSSLSAVMKIRAYGSKALQ